MTSRPVGQLHRLTANDDALIAATSRLIAEHGSGLHHEFDTAGGLRAALAAGVLDSWLVIARGERETMVAGHMALLAAQPGHPVESGLSVTHPQFRNRGVMGLLRARVDQVGAAAGLAGYASQPMLGEVYSQRAHERVGSVPTAVVFGVADNPRRPGHRLNGGWYFRPLRAWSWPQQWSADAALAGRHAEMLGAIAQRLAKAEWPARVPEPSLAPPDAWLRAHQDGAQAPSAAVVRLDEPVPGRALVEVWPDAAQETPTAVGSLVVELLATAVADWNPATLLVDVALPDYQPLAAELEGYGLSIAGLLPNRFGDTPALRLQHIRRGTLDEIAVVGGLMRELTDYVASERARVLSRRSPSAPR